MDNRLQTRWPLKEQSMQRPEVNLIWQWFPPATVKGNTYPCITHSKHCDLGKSWRRFSGIPQPQQSSTRMCSNASRFKIHDDATAHMHDWLNWAPHAWFVLYYSCSTLSYPHFHQLKILYMLVDSKVLRSWVKGGSTVFNMSISLTIDPWRLDCDDVCILHHVQPALESLYSLEIQQAWAVSTQSQTAQVACTRVILLYCTSTVNAEWYWEKEKAFHLISVG